MKQFLLAIAVLTIFAVTVHSAAAQTQQQINWCNGIGASSLDQQIGGCSAMIKSNHYTGHPLATIYNNRANYYGGMGRYDLAKDDYDAAIAADPNFVLAYNNRGLTFAAQNQFERALLDFDQAVGLDPNNADALNNRCFDRAILGQLQGALADCNKALALTPDDVSVNGCRGFVYLKMKNYDAAIADYDIALKANAQDPSSLYSRGIARLGKGDSTDGNADIAAAKKLSPDVAKIFTNYGVKGP